MDLKPSNVALSGESDAVLIDISGIGDVTRQWLCSEMLESKKDPLSWSIAEQQQSDIWVLGQIILAMADACCADEQKQLLGSVALATTRLHPRIPLGEVIAALSGCPSPIVWLEILPLGLTCVKSAVRLVPCEEINIFVQTGRYGTSLPGPSRTPSASPSQAAK